MFRKRTPSFTNWVTRPDGSIEQNSVVIRKGGIVDGIYEVEVLDGAIGAALETDFYCQYTIVKSIDTSRSDPAVQEIMAEGHVLVAINNRHTINEEFEDVISYLTMLRVSRVSRKLRFLDPSKCPVAVYEEKIAMQMKTEKDMYGFLRSAEYIELERESRLAIAPAIVKRDLAWVHYLKAIGGAVNLKPGGVFKPSYQLKMLVRRGVPAAYRSLVWKHISMSDQYRLRHPRSYYSDLVDRINEDLNAKVRDDIDKDLLRTFPDHDYFRSGCGLATLCRVLSAYALHNPEVAYCQSLNFIAGTLLLYLEEEDGFWLFCALLDYILPAEQYSRSMVGTFVDQAVLGHIVVTRFPVLHKKLEDFQLDLSIVSTQWFMCVFVNTLRTETALRVLDVLLNEGDKVIFRVAVALLRLHEAEIEAAGDAAALHQCLKGMGSSITNADMLLALAYKDFDNTFDPVRAAAPPFYPSLFARPSSWSRKILQFRQVPPQLEGIGVGHLGPASDIRPSIVRCSEAGETSKAAAASTVNDGLVTRDSNSRPSLSLDLANVRVLFREIITRKKKQCRRGRSEHLRRIRSEDYHRAFRRDDLSMWRDRYRPAVEGEIAHMERNREKWHARRQVEGDVEAADTSHSFEMEPAKEDSEGTGNSLADTEEVSTVSTMGDDDSGGDGDQEGSGLDTAVSDLAKKITVEVGKRKGGNNAPC